MKRQALVALATLCIAAPSLAFAESETLDVPPFHAVDVSSGIRAVVAGGGSQSVVAGSTRPEDLTDLRWEVRDGRLLFWYDWRIGNLFELFADRQITITVAAPSIDGLEASSGASIEATGVKGDSIDLEASSGAHISAPAIDGKTYVIEASSGAGIETSGSCVSANVESSSGASIAAKTLDCAAVDLEVSSGAHIEITANETIRAEASSGGSATVHGGPRVEEIETGSGGSLDFPS